MPLYIYLQFELQMEINKKYGYVRVSSKSQESNSSIESQKEQLSLIQVLMKPIE